ncbi:RICIN domain-containing protein [Micromonospora sp. GCM10011542]|uniref:RICIN domain-containing protein n=1 Tax=Micromonospora sp. GCM10011542 TaxID=3317337 RepID=UPI0036160DBD
MADPRDDLRTIADGVRRVTTLPTAQSLRHRSDKRRRRRTVATAAGLAVLAVTAGTTLARARDHVETPERVVGPAAGVPSSIDVPATPSAGPREILGGRRQVLIVLPGAAGAALAIGPDDDRVRATTERTSDDRRLWVLHPEGNSYRIMSATPGGAGPVCMTVVHDAAPGSVRARVCDPAAQSQLFRIDRVADGSYSIFQGRRYVQVVDGSNALVPDLPEALTTTYAFEDRGPAAGR